MKYNVKFRLDTVLIEVKNVSGAKGDGGHSLAGAIENARKACLTRFLRAHRGMTIEYLGGHPRIVGVETADAWEDT